MPAQPGKYKDFGKKLGFIGLGNIGMPMFNNLAEAGFDLTVFDLRLDATSKAAEKGASVASSIAAIAASCDIISIALVHERQIDSIYYGDEGLLAHSRPGTVLLFHSTLPPKLVQKYAQEAAERGILVVDAPVSGANIAAAAGTLSFILGGDESLIGELQPLWDTMGANVFHMGGVGLGQVGKLVNGTMYHMAYLATLEALSLARAYGVDELKMIDIARVSTGTNWMVRHWGYMDDLMMSHTRAGSDELVHLHFRKDIVDSLAAAEVERTPMPLAALGAQIYADLISPRLDADHPSARRAARRYAEEHPELNAPDAGQAGKAS